MNERNTNGIKYVEIDIFAVKFFFCFERQKMASRPRIKFNKRELVVVCTLCMSHGWTLKRIKTSGSF